MKSVALLIGILSSTQSMAAILPHALPPVLVKDVVQSGNLMPSTTPRTVLTEIELEIMSCAAPASDDIDVQVLEDEQFGYVGLSFTFAETFVDCMGGERRHRVTVETRKLRPHQAMRVVNPLLIETNFTH